MHNHTKALATAAALTMTGCSMLSPPKSAKPELSSAEREAQIESIFGKPGERKNVSFGQPGDASPIVDTIPIPKAPRTAPSTQPRVTVADVLPPVAPVPEAAPPTAMGTVEAEAAKPAEPTMDQLMALLRKQVQAAPKSLTQSLALELLQLSGGGKVEDLTAMGVSANDNRLVGDLAAALQSASSVAAGPNTSLAERAGPIVHAAKAWETAADLKIPTLALASRVDSFGIYTPVEAKFPAGKRSVVIIYCEVANFTSEKSGAEYITRLTQQDSLVTADGLLEWRPNPEQIEDRCRNQRHDFYLIKKLTLPETLATGKYTLRMTVTDNLGNKTTDTGLLEIEIVK